MKMRVTSRGEDKKLLDNNNSDSSMTGIIMRAAQPFSLRYPLVDVEGSYGSLVESGNWASPRYCLTGDAIVNTNKGLVRIRDLADEKENSDKEVDFLFKGFERSTSANIMFNSGKHPVYKVELANGMEFEGTANHPVLTKKGWVEIRNLKEDEVVINTKMHTMFGNKKINAKSEALIAKSYPSMGLSDNVLQASQYDQSLFLAHLFDQIGYINPMTHEAFFTSKRKKILQEVQIILATNFGIFSRIEKIRETYRLYIAINSIYNFVNILAHHKLYSEKGILAYREQLEKDGFNFTPVSTATTQVVSVKYSGHKVVYSPKINEEGNEYTANAMIHHNTSARLSAIGTHLFHSINNDTISEWRDNYDDTAQYPAVLPSKGFYGIVNGTSGIGIGASASIPATNLREVNEAMIKLLWDPSLPFEDIYCAPDFPTGAVLLNEDEVKEALKEGTGKSCRLRSVVEYDPKDRALIVKEIPYGVYTNTICKQLEDILGEDGENPGIDRFNDLTGNSPNIKIYLSRRANPDAVLKYLFKKTSLESYYGINMTMLGNNGRKPQVFGWKDALLAHINHEIDVYTREYQFMLDKAMKRLHIVEGLLKAISIVDEVVTTIRASKNSAEAAIQLQKEYAFTALQAAAILKITLSQLVNLEIVKYQKEQATLKDEIAKLEEILNDDTLLKKEIEKGFREVINKYGDERRTQIFNITTEDEVEPTEIRQLVVSLTNRSYLILTESSTLYAGKRGNVGSKLKLKPDEYVVSSLTATTNDVLGLFSGEGQYYSLPLVSIPVGELVAAHSIIDLPSTADIKTISINARKDVKKYYVFITKNGYLKKTLSSEYSSTRKGGVNAIKLDSGDKIISVFAAKGNERIGLLTKKGRMVITSLDDIRAIGRVTRGVIGVRLDSEDEIVDAHLIPDGTWEILTITEAGQSKRTLVDEFPTTGRGAKGVIAHKVDENDNLVGFLPLNKDGGEIIVGGSNTQVRLKVLDIPLQGRATNGVKTVKLKNNEKITSILQI